jgi:hypothetical protein
MIDWQCAVCGFGIEPGGFYVKVVDVTDSTYPVERVHDGECAEDACGAIRLQGHVPFGSLIHRPMLDILEYSSPVPSVYLDRTTGRAVFRI